jgi:uncharacterized membrane protein
LLFIVVAMPTPPPSDHPNMSSTPAPHMAAGVVLGLGLGGFADGIALHQIAQWHSMGSAVLPPITMDAMKRNMAWDGWFHAATLVITTTGVFFLLSAARRRLPLPSPSQLSGQMLLGWGLFNLVEGLVDHHLLEIHHVRDMPAHVPMYDWLFLGVAGVGFILLGWLLSRPRAPMLS